VTKIKLEYLAKIDTERSSVEKEYPAKNEALEAWYKENGKARPNVRRLVR